MSSEAVKHLAYTVYLCAVLVIYVVLLLWYLSAGSHPALITGALITPPVTYVGYRVRAWGARQEPRS